MPSPRFPPLRRLALRGHTRLKLLAAAFGLMPLQVTMAADYPAPIEALQQEGLEVHGEFEAPNGMTGYAASHRGQPMTIFVTADGEHAIVGNLIDSQANNLSQAPLERLVQGPMDDALWQDLGNSAWIADGSDAAPRIVYAFTDPNCPYCTRLYHDSRPWVESGRVQIRHVMVGILDSSSPRQAVTMLAAADPSAMLAAHENGHRVEPMPDLPRDLEQRLQDNHELFYRLGMVATPGIVYYNGDTLEMSQGIPSPEQLSVIMGSQP